DFAPTVGLLVEIEDFHEVGALAGQLLVSDDVYVQLVEGDVFSLGSFGGLEVNNRGLVGVEAADEVDTAVDGDSGGYVNLHLLLGVEGLLELGAVLVEVA